ncbi:MAG: 2OG-Fe(II) oxygenase family protein [Nanoarchaeota archaeon]
MMRKFSTAEVRKLRQRFKNGKPFPHAVIENFLTNHKQLLSALKKERFYKKDTDLFSFSQTSNLFYSKNTSVKAAVGMFSSEQFAGIISRISGIKLKQGAVDVSGSLYEKTNCLLCHDDRLEGRKIAFIVYLSESFTAADGGALVFLGSRGNHPRNKAIAYPPLENSLMVFAVSKESWHEVEEVLSDKKRYTIGGWLH